MKMGWDKLGSKKVLQISYVLFGVFYLYADPAAGFQIVHLQLRSIELLMVPSLSLILILLHTKHITPVLFVK
jgi:hypothetical protein